MQDESCWNDDVMWRLWLMVLMWRWKEVVRMMERRSHNSCCVGALWMMMSLLLRSNIWLVIGRVVMRRLLLMRCIFPSCFFVLWGVLLQCFVVVCQRPCHGDVLLLWMVLRGRLRLDSYLWPRKQHLREPRNDWRLKSFIDHKRVFAYQSTRSTSRTTRKELCYTTTCHLTNTTQPNTTQLPSWHNSTHVKWQVPQKHHIMVVVLRQSLSIEEMYSNMMMSVCRRID